MAVYSYKYTYEDPAKGWGELCYVRKGDFGDIAKMVDSLVEGLGKLPAEKYVRIDIYKDGVPFHAWPDATASKAIIIVEKLRTS